MDGAGFLVMFVTTFCIFTLVMGAGVIFYQNTLSFAHEQSYKTTDSMIGQVTALLITIMFALGALMFLAAMVKFAGRRR